MLRRDQNTPNAATGKHFTYPLTSRFFFKPKQHKKTKHNNVDKISTPKSKQKIKACFPGPP